MAITNRSKAEKEVVNTAEQEANAPAPAPGHVPLKGWAFVVKKLFTKEDPQFLHKTLGLLSVISFIYRYAYVYNVKGNLGFDGTPLDWATIFLHTALSTSSLIFHVLKNRILRKPYIIWEEYRLHAISFTLRCTTIFILGYLGVSRFLLFPGTMVWHLIADEISNRHANLNTKTGKPLTTVRGTDKLPTPMKLLTRTYAFYQFSAIASHIIPCDRTMDMGFNTLIAIQSSAFLMTLFRKSLIPYAVHGLGYTFCLVVSGYHIYRVHSSIYFALGVMTVFLSRITFGINKYYLWSMFAFVAALPDLMAIAEQNKYTKMVDDYGIVPFNVTEYAGRGQQYLAAMPQLFATSSA
jgi:hypothetical protein